MTHRIIPAAVVAAGLATLAASQIAAAKTVYFDAHLASSITDAGDKSHAGTEAVPDRFDADAAHMARIESGERVRVVFGATTADSKARAFDGVYVQGTFETGPEPRHLRVLNELDELLFDNRVVGLASDELQLSTVQGVNGVFYAGSGPGGSAAGTAIALPGFDIAVNAPFAGGRGTSATAVPEPATGLLLLAGASAFLLASRRRRGAIG